MAGNISQGKITQFSSGLSQALTRIDANVTAQVLAEALPIIGDNLKDAAAVATPLHYAANLGAAIKAGLDGLVGSASYTAEQVQTAINAALTAAGFGGVGVVADFSQNGDLKLAFATQDSGDTVSVAVEGNLGLGHLDIQTSGTATTTLAETLTFTAGIDASGFYLATGPDTHFTLSTTTKLPGFTAAVEMGGIGLQATNPGTTDFTGQFDLTLKDGNGDGKLRVAELGGDLLDATLTGNATINLNLQTTLPAGSVMPQLGTQFHTSWAFDHATVNPADDNSDFGSAPTVQFLNGTINLGSFFDGMAGKVLSQISEITAPLMPLIAFLTTPIPLLSDLGSSKVTLLDFMGLSPEETSAIQGLADIAALAAQVAAFADAGTVKIDLGSVTVGGDIRSDLLEDLTTEITGSRTALGLQNADLGKFLDLAGKIAGGGLAFPLLNDVGAIGDMLLGKNVDLFSYETTFGFDYEFKQFFPVLGPIGVTLGGLFGLSAMLDFGFDTQGFREYVDGGMTDPSKIFDGFYVRATDDAGNPVTGFRLTAGITAGVVATIGIAEVGVEGDITANIDFGLDPALDPLGTGKIRGAILALTPIADLFDPSGSISAGLRAYLEVGFSPFSIEFSFDSPRITLLDFDGDTSNPPILVSDLPGGDMALNIGDRAAQRLVGNLTDGAEKIAITLAFNPLFPDTPTGLLVSGFGTGKLHDFPTRIIGNGGNSSDDIFIDTRVTVAAVLTGGLGRDALTGGAAGDRLSGDEGADVLDGNGGKDRLFGGIGQDRLIGGAGSDTLDGGDGLDTASYSTATAAMTIDLQTMIFTGDGAGDVLTGVERFEATSFNDLITGNDASNPLLGGMGGNDTIRGLGGDDLLIGGAGDDSLNGGTGNDLLIGVDGADTLAGGTGIDTLSYVTSKAPVSVSLLTNTGTGGDALGDVLSEFENLTGSALPFGDLADRYTPLGKPITAGTGDTLEGNGVANVISGLGGADCMDGGAGNDILYGDAKDATPGTQTAMDFEADTLQGGLGDDSLFGQTGNDDLDGGAGRDSLDGAQGDDHLRTLDTLGIDILDGGEGVNRLSADYSDKTVSITWILGQINDFTFADGDTQRNFQNLGELDTGNQRDEIRLVGVLDDGYANIIRTNGGGDIVQTGKGNDRVEGGGGNDLLYGGDGSDYVDGGSGDDFVNGGNDVKLLKFGGFGVIVGLEPGSGPDTLYGGDGVDTLSFRDLVQFVGYLGAGGGVFRLGVTVDLLTNTTGGAATGIVIGGFENIIGTDYGDDLLGTDADNVFTPLRGGGLFSGATGGPDRIDGRGGIDTLIIDFSLADLSNSLGIVTNGTSIYRNTIGNLATVDSYIYTNIEQLRITGASKNDVLYSWTLSANNDYLNGLAGDDTLGGKGGSDTLLGGTGNDILSAQGTFAPDYSGTAGGRDVIDGGAGNDLIEDIAFNFLPVLGPDALFKLDGGSGVDTLSADFSNQTAAILWNSATPSNLDFADGAYARNFEQLRRFASGSGNDVITQDGRVSNQFHTGGGDDTVNGGLGVDTIYGGDGNDLLVLDCSTGDAAGLSGLQGGGSSNTFFRSFSADGSRPDSLFYTQIERMFITGSAKADSFAGSLGSDTLLGGDGNDSVNGANGGNDSIDGGAGDDTLLGSGGAFAPGANDVLLGGDGNDSLRSQTGDDRITAGAGNDTLIADYSFANGYGLDLLSGGTGDDLVQEINFASGFSYAKVTDRIRLDGGAGTDTLAADFGNQTQAITFTSGLANSVDFANGSYFHDFEVITNLFTGSGNDSLTQLGRATNVFAVNGGDDTVNAGLGIDSVFGGDGNDLLIIDYSQGDDANLGGVTIDGSGAYTRRDLVTTTIIDWIYAPQFERVSFTGTSKSDSLFGFVGDDVIVGGAGNDTLRGGTGKDALDGGAGTDTADYSDKSAAVVVTLNGSTDATVSVGGLAEDTVRAIENLIGGSGFDALTGDGLANALSGGFGNDTLNGGLGADTLTGGFGNDLFAVDTTADSVVEAAGGGLDTVQTTLSYNLAAGQEIEAFLVANPLSVAALRLTGNEFAQTITGNAGGNFLDGGTGADTLVGLAGADRFVFTALTGGVDTVQDFTSGQDSLRILAAGFAGGLVAGAPAKLLQGADFASLSGSAAARFLYDTSGADAGLYFDATGGSGADAVLFARLTGLPVLVAADIILF